MSDKNPVPAGIALAVLVGAFCLLALFFGYRPTEADSFLAGLLVIVIASATALYALLKKRK